jgi:chaperonin GroES
MNVRPLQDRILVRRVEEVEKTRGGIIIPDSAKLDVKAGDRILFGKYAGTEIKVDGVEHIILREDEVLGVIE